MKNKKLLLIVAIVVICLALLVTFAACCRVADVETVIFNPDGSSYIIPSADSGAISAEDVLKIVKGKSVFSLDKDKIAEQIQVNHPGFVCVGIVVQFPNTLTVYLVQGQACVKLSTGTKEVYLDRFGNVAEPSEGQSDIDISSAFRLQTISDLTVGSKFRFSSETDNQRLEQVLDAINAMWRMYVEYNDISAVLGESGVFGYNADGDLLINVKKTATVVVKSPEQVDIAEHVIKGLSVYFKAEDNLQTSGTVITVSRDGRVSTSK